MLTAKKFDAVAIARAGMDNYEIKVQENKIAWEREVQEQEFKQALLEGRVANKTEKRALDWFKVKVWLG